MAEDYSVVDVDMHYIETVDALGEYMREPWATRFERDPNASNFFLPSGSTGSRERWGKIKRKYSSDYFREPINQDQIADSMDLIGVDKAILISQRMLAASHITADDGRSVVFSEAYVDYVLDKIVDPTKHIYSAIPLPHQDPERAADLIDDYGDEDGLVAGCFITGDAEPPLGNRRYDVIYEAATKASLPIIFHTGGSGLDSYHKKGYGKFMETHVLGFLESNLSQATSLIIQGVPEKFPDLDIVFMESGVFWVAMLMARLDEEYLKRAEEAPLLERRPSDYMKELHFGTQPLEISFGTGPLEQVIEMIGGSGSLLYASDYPHWDYDRPTTVTELPFLSEDEKRAVLGGNAEELFAL